MPDYITMTKEQVSILMREARIRRNPRLIAQLAQYNPVDINRLALKADTIGLTLLDYIVRDQNEQTFINFITMLPVQTVSQAITKLNCHQKTLLHMAAEYQSKKAFLTLIEIANTSAINKLLASEKYTRWSLLQLILCHHPEDSLLALINKAGVSTLDKLVIEDSRLVWVVIKEKSEAISIRLINRISSTAFSKIAMEPDRWGVSLFHHIIKKLSTPCLYYAITQLSSENFYQCVQSLNNQLLCLMIEQMYHSLDLTLLVLERLDEQGLLFLLNKLENHEKNKLPLIKVIFFIKKITDKLAKEPLGERDFFRTGKGTAVSFDYSGLIRSVREEGFASYYEVALLLENIPEKKHYVFTDIIKELYFYNLLFTGGSVHHWTKTLLDPSLENKIKNYEILYKVIQPCNFATYIAQFSNFNFRPKIRKEKPGATHKFIHLTGEIKPYTAREAHTCNKKRIKKNSTTLLSPELVTPVFGEHHQDGRALAGLLFDFNQCVVKAMLAYDRGTVSRDWVGSQVEVKNYQRKLSGVNYTDVEEFKKSVRSSTQLNEVLAEIPKEAIKGVFMGNTSLASKAIALLYANELRRDLELNVPIYCYDKINKTLCPQSESRIEKHIEFYIGLARALRENLLSSSYHLRFWGGVLYESPDKSVRKTLPSTAYTLVTQLDQLLAVPDRELDLKLDIKLDLKLDIKLDEIRTVLAQSSSPTWKRDAITANSYKDCLKLLNNVPEPSFKL